MQLFNDALDDEPNKTEISGFDGFDCVAEPAALAPGLVRAGENMWCDIDRMLQTRPGLAFVSHLTRETFGAANQVPRGMGYYDIPGFERILATGDGKLYEIVSAGDNVTSNVLSGPTASATNDTIFAQLVDHMFWCDGTLHWSLWNSSWSHGTVTTFSSTSAMPTWKLICAHNFRLIALAEDGRTIYASAVGQASSASDWVSTENIRLGSGEGDTVRRIISGQGGNLIVLCERSAWMVNTSDASVAKWTTARITELTGCVEGKTAVQVGQDVIFLSSFGVVSLGALATTDSINPKTVLSAPIQPLINRINPTAINTCWAVMYRDLYLLAVPLDSATVPDTFLVYHTLTKRWQTPWTATLPTWEDGEAPLTFSGFTCGVLANFGGTTTTIIADNTGRALRFDAAQEKDNPAAAVSQDIPCHATTKALNHDAPDFRKQPFFGQIEFYNSTSNAVQVNLVRDGNLYYPAIAAEDCDILAAALATNSLTSFPIRFPLTFQASALYKRVFHLRDQARYVEAGYQFISPQGRLRIRAVRLSAFFDTADLES